jgi:hypothetical protein
LKEIEKNRKGIKQNKRRKETNEKARNKQRRLREENDIGEIWK